MNLYHFLFILLVIPVLYYIYRIHSINNAYKILYAVKEGTCLRKFPYPFKAAMTIASDIDKTGTLEKFLEIQDFICTDKISEWGEGAGLEIANTFFTIPLENEFSYLSSRPCDRAAIEKFAKAGFVDAIHSWGNGFKDRNSAITALEELARNGLNFEVWINHALNRSNFGNWRKRYDLGDNKDTEYYHADLTVAHGVKYVWIGSSTWIIGQATPIRLNTYFGSFDPDYPIQSAKNVSKALIKHLLSIFRLGRERYALHASNDLARPTILDDGQRVYQFSRYHNHFNGIGRGAIAKTMHYNLSERVIRQLKTSNGYAILYTHFGRTEGCEQAITKETREALRFLSREARSGEVYVTTTLKLLKYYMNHKFLNWRCQEDSEKVVITINSVDDPLFGSFVPSMEDLQGITFYVPADKEIQVFIGDMKIDSVINNPADENHRESVTIPLTRLKYPEFSIKDYE